MSTYDAREAAHPLCEHGVALVRHRRAALLLLAERFEGLADLAPLEVPDFGRDPLQRAGHQRQRRNEVRVAVARDHLSRNNVRPQAERLADVLLALWVDPDVGANRATHPANRSLS